MKRKILFIQLIVLVCVLGCLLIACSPADLDAPQDLVYDDGVLSWAAVAHADRYQVEVNGEVVAEVPATYYIYATSVQTTFRVAAVSDSQRYRTSAFSTQYVYKPVVDSRAILNAPTVYEINGNGVVVWSYVSGATGYRVLVNGNTVATVGTVTQYTLGPLVTGSYSVQVQAVGSDEYRDSPRSAIYRLDVTDGRITPPMIAAPVVTFDAEMRRLVWSGINHATSYVVYQNGQAVQQIATDDAMHRYAEGNGYRYYYAPLINVRNTQLYVVALADGTRYADSSKSNVLSFPQQEAGIPHNLHVDVVDGATVLLWDAMTNCAGYRVHVEQNGATVGDYFVPNNSTHLSLADGMYAISVAGDGDGYVFNPTAYCAEVEVAIAGGRLQPLLLDTPQSPYMYQKTLFFDAVSHATSYQIWVTTPYDDELGDYTYYTQSPRFALPVLLYKTVVYMYVRALGDDGYAAGGWSAGVCYYPDNSDPDVVDNPDGSDIDEIEQQVGSGSEEPYVEPAPKFPYYSVLTVPGGMRIAEDKIYWSEVPGADHYLLVLDGVEIPLSSTDYRITDTDSAHVCKVRAVSTTELLLDSPFSAEVRYVRTRIAPPAGVTLSRHTLMWDTVADANGYTLQIGAETYPLTGNSVDLESLLPYDGTYTMRVCAHTSYAWLADSLFSQTVTYVADYELAGTQHKPYALATKQDLDLLQTYPTAYFRLTNDIAVGDVTPLFSAQNAFAGMLDGAGFALTDIRLDATDSVSNGLFGCMYGASFSNITFNFVTITMNDSARAGVLAAEVMQCTFDRVSVVASASGARSFGTVGASTGSTFTGCALQVDYTQTTATAALGGIVGDSKQDTFADCTVSGSLAGGIYVGAIAATATDSSVDGCVVGNALAPFAYTAADAYVGAVGKGSLTACNLRTTATFTLSGNCFAAGFGGQLTCSALVGMADVSFAGHTGTMYAGGAVAFGAVDIADLQVKVSLTGATGTLYAGGVVGYAQGLCVCSADTSVNLSVDFAATEGRYLGGIVGFGPATYTGAVQANILISNTVSVGRVSGITPTPTEEGWIVADKE